jgi:hypothetical protein
VAPRRSHFLPAKVVMLLFRGKLLDALRTRHRRGELRRPEAMSPERFTSLLNRLGRKVKWNVRVCTRYAHGRGVSLYLARYVKGGPFANTQIVRANPTEVLFRYTPQAEAGSPKRSAILALAPASFLARVLQHAPEPGRHTVRYYGLYAHACGEQLNAARALHSQAPVEAPVPIEWQALSSALPAGAGGHPLPALSGAIGAWPADPAQPRPTLMRARRELDPACPCCPSLARRLAPGEPQTARFHRPGE